jgi:OOP family OmpA-OmpF porin
VATPPASVPAVQPPAAVTNTVTSLNQDLARTVLNFPTGSAVLPAASAPDLRRAADKINSLPAGTVIEIGGHTDNTGDANANLALSQRRADAVRDALVRDGVNASRLVAKGYGQTRPIASNDTPDGRLRNRRTEFTVASSNGSTTTTTTTAPASP